ncbi:endonuclease/exonuclease/phosphatase family protein [Kitasatospora purpeofusca]|uniref:endonuclease/exonuclease/phosphatase family protein n=1 Tax=Kitasatospora purpeofusca TaxID=67352 RepID=UPI002E0D9F40|nr:endonuclease/exonuclease/phosphatase family protein [Kitasatospora purpeofusca]WSR40185.1 endonuclease/exonuclease/phosphatase family protein [Kitasatospora purpeofusca]
MTNSQEQDFLFGTANTVEDSVAASEFRLLALNIESPSADRVRRQLDWIYGIGANVLVLTEVKVNDAGDLLVRELTSSGFKVTRPRTGPNDRYMTVIATKGYQSRPVHLDGEDSRFHAVRLTTHFGNLDVVGLYSLTNGMSAESSTARWAYQRRVVTALGARAAAEPTVPILVTGDLNVVEPGHGPAPSRALFEDHDFDFYLDFGRRLGLVDSYRQTHPDAADLTWYGPKGGQRLDHVFTTSDVHARVTSVGFDHDVRTSRLSDHSALRLTVG